MSKVVLVEERYLAWFKGDSKALEELNEKQFIGNLLSVKQFSEKYPAFPQGGLRHDIFNAETNGLKEFGAIIRKGGRG